MRPQMGDDFPLLASPAPHVGQVSPVPRLASEPRNEGPDSPSGAEASPWKRTLSWRQLLVDSPPAWAASPETHTMGSGVDARRAGAPSPQPPFPWPAPSLNSLSSCPEPPRLPPNLRHATQEAVHAENIGTFSQDEEQEILRFLSHVSKSPKTQSASVDRGFAVNHPPKTPSPRRRRSREAQDDTLVSTGVWSPFSNAMDASGQDSAWAESSSGVFADPGSASKVWRARGEAEGAHHTPLKTAASPVSGRSSPGPGLSTGNQRNPTIELGEVLPACLVSSCRIQS